MQSFKNSDELKKFIVGTKDIDFLKKLKQAESKDKNRKTVIDAIDKQIQKSLLVVYGYNTKLIDKLLNQPPLYREGLEKEPIPNKTKKKVLERDSYMCQICYSKNNLIIHHIDPQGLASMENLVTLCKVCHAFIHKLLRLKGYRYYY